jgi:hypothetical protein
MTDVLTSKGNTSRYSGQGQDECPTGSLARCIASYWEWLIKNLSDIITLYT